MTQAITQAECGDADEDADRKNATFMYEDQNTTTVVNTYSIDLDADVTNPYEVKCEQAYESLPNKNTTETKQKHLNSRELKRKPFKNKVKGWLKRKKQRL
ncbi:hypothetical protein KP509_21G074100 [Ceratopteris richardii]|nr:hypothetical protein KP509_21G074100 [Ceratopteris richardii]